jgi:hypothetical protein
MRQAQARKISDAYLHAPKRSERHLHVVAEDAIAEREARPRVVEDLRIEAPAVQIPDWAPPAEETPDWAEAFADARWDDRLGSPDYEERDGRRTVLVTGRPEGKAVPRRDASPVKSARVRRHTPTRARLAGRPDRVALWAVALGLLMAAMAGFSGNGSSHSSQVPSDPAPAPLLSR